MNKYGLDTGLFGKEHCIISSFYRVNCYFEFSLSSLSLSLESELVSGLSLTVKGGKRGKPQSD